MILLLNMDTTNYIMEVNNLMNYIKNKVINTQNLILPILFHLIIYALDVACVCCLFMVEILCKSLLLPISSLCIQ